MGDKSVESCRIDDVEPHLESPAPILPTLEDIQALAEKTQREKNEYGVSLYITSEGKAGVVYDQGDNAQIFEPEPPQELRGKIRAGVFIHCHPVFTDETVEKGTPLHMLPSYGDFNANLWSRVIGGYLNIASEFGLTMNIGVQGISREDNITRRLRKGVGANEIAEQAVWKVLSGKQAGTVWVNNEMMEAVQNKASIDEEVVLLSNTQPLGIRYFLHLSWNKLAELKSVYGNLESICFGNGIEQLVTYLGIHTPHFENLGEATRILHTEPQITHY